MPDGFFNRVVLVWVGGCIFTSICHLDMGDGLEEESTKDSFFFQCYFIVLKGNPKLHMTMIMGVRWGRNRNKSIPTTCWCHFSWLNDKYMYFHGYFTCRSGSPVPYYSHRSGFQFWKYVNPQVWIRVTYGCTRAHPYMGGTCWYMVYILFVFCSLTQPLPTNTYNFNVNNTQIKKSVRYSFQYIVCVCVVS